MRPAPLALLLASSVFAGPTLSNVDASEVASLQVNDLEKRVLLKLRDGKELEAPREDGHVWQMDPAVSADRKWVGWLVAFDGQANTAAPKGVALLRGRELRTLKVERMIWRWAFYKDTLVVALGPERPHEPAEYVWYGLPNLEVRGSIKRFELNEYDPEWAHAARLRSRLE